jgi:hypothetical protein
MKIPIQDPLDTNTKDGQLQSSQDFGLGMEMYQPRLSARRSKSLSAKADIIAHDKFAEGLPMKRKRGRNTKAKEAVEDTSTEGASPLAEALHEVDPVYVVKDRSAEVPVGNVDAIETESGMDRPMDASDEPQSLRCQTGETAKAKEGGKSRNAPPDKLNSETAIQSQAVEQSKLAPKKRRGRPPKAPLKKAAMVVENSDTDEDDIETRPEHEDRKTEKGAAKSKEIVASDDDDDEVQEEVNTVQVPSRNPSLNPSNNPAPPESTPPQKPSTELQTPNKPRTPHSPLNSGKVPYRVGLSKKNRIAPLLKIIRK